MHWTTWYEARHVNLSVNHPVGLFKQDTSICVSQEASCSLSSHVFLRANLMCSCTGSPNAHQEKVKCTVHCWHHVLVTVQTYLLFPPLLPLVLCVLQHLLSPQVKEVGWIGVELQTLLPIVPAEGPEKTRNLVTFWLACWRSFLSVTKLNKNIT